MAAQIIDGKAIAGEISAALSEQIAHYRNEAGRPPGLAVVLVGDNPASQVYVRMKERAAERVGIYFEKHHLPRDVEQSDLLRLVRRLGERDDIHGILVQLPLPGHLSQEAVTRAVPPEKDVDGFHPVNAGLLITGSAEGFVPCTPAGVMELLRRTGVELSGKRAVVVGRSNIVGKPTAVLLLQRDATVTICHSRTRDLAAVCREADVLVVAAGKPGVVRREHVKPGAVVIDVGVNRLADGGLVGDVAFDEVREVASHITPVPGGVGPMTIAMLLANTVKAAQRRTGA